MAVPVVPASLGAEAGGSVSSEGTILVAGGPDGAALDEAGAASAPGDDPAAGDSLSANATVVDRVLMSIAAAKVPNAGALPADVPRIRPIFFHLLLISQPFFK